MPGCTDTERPVRNAWKKWTTSKIKEELERIGINYDFVKKTYSISLFYKKISRSRTITDVKNAKNIQ